LDFEWESIVGPQKDLTSIAIHKLCVCVCVYHTFTTKTTFLRERERDEEWANK
jgi:hypothetical protein